jgi:hypothetical protein
MNDALKGLYELFFENSPAWPTIRSGVVSYGCADN